MKVLSVKQPFATLLALGYKGFETRSWATKHRGETGIHSSKKIDKEACRQVPIKSVLADHGFDEKSLKVMNTILDSVKQAASLGACKT